MSARFNQPDSIIPEQSQGTQAWDRFAYTNNNPVKYTDPSGHDIGFPPNPFIYDTLTIGLRGIAKAVIGIDVDIEININLKALREADFDNFDVSLNIDATISAGVAVEDAVGLVVYGHDGTVLDQSGFQLIGKDGEIPINAGGCIETVCGTALYTLDSDDPDSLNGEGFFVGAGLDPAAIDLSADLIGGSDWVVYGKGDDFKTQVPFINKEFLKTVPYLGQFLE